MTSSRRSGRRRGGSDTRSDILAAARTTFASLGFDGATIRQVAQKAGVDPALVHHFFGSKEQLFVEVVEPPLDPLPEALSIAEGTPDELGARLVRRSLQIWDSSAGDAGRALMRRSIQHEWSANLIREFMLSRMIRPLVETVESDPDRMQLRSALVMSQMSGLIMSRYLLRVEPLASAPIDHLVATIGPTIQHYLTGDLSGWDEEQLNETSPADTTK